MVDKFKTIKRLLYDVGFSRIGNIYCRVINDIFQCVEMRHIIARKEYQIEFGILPLCVGITSYSQGCVYNLSNFRPSEYTTGYNGGWSYAGADNLVKEDCVNSIRSYVDDFLLPLLIKAENSKRVFSEVTCALKTFEQTRLSVLHQSGTRDMARPFEQRMLLDSCLLYTALVNENYSYALNALEARKRVNEGIYQRHRLNYPNSTQSRGVKQSINNLQSMIECIKQGRLENIQVFLSKKTDESMLFLHNIV